MISIYCWVTEFNMTAELYAMMSCGSHPDRYCTIAGMKY
jgi:hypothetical protein